MSEPAARSATASSLEIGVEVRRALRELMTRDREVLWLAYVDGFTHREIAEVIGVEEPSVKVIAFRARARFAEILGRRGLGPEDLP